MVSFLLLNYAGKVELLVSAKPDILLYYTVAKVYVLQVVLYSSILLAKSQCIELLIAEYGQVALQINAPDQPGLQ